jgi:hypothetical protein
MAITLLYIDKIKNEKNIGKIDDSHLFDANPTCLACSKDMSEHEKKNITLLRTNKNYHSFKLVIENDRFQTIYGTKGNNQIIGLFATECLNSLSKYRVGMIIKLKKESKEMSFITQKADNEYQSMNYPNSCFAIEQMISREMISKEQK